MPVIASTLWWSILIIAPFAYGVFVTLHASSGEGTYFDLAILAMTFFLTCAVLWTLWSYLQGQDWTRTLVLVVLGVKIAYALFRAYHVRHFPRTWQTRAIFTVRVGDLLFSIYMFFWLLTKEARRYFHFPPIHWESTNPEGRTAP
jgi:hypothetical protein